tara:strand:- start:708 stop:872 length:165 start_codon:yes stop_codon:yes gene_type:complete
MNDVAELQAARRYITGVLLNLDVDTREMTISNFLVILDHFIDNPEDYRDLINGR